MFSRKPFGMRIAIVFKYQTANAVPAGSGSALGQRWKMAPELGGCGKFATLRIPRRVFGNRSRAMWRDLARVGDRRGRQRYHLNAPLIMMVGNREISAYTRDLTNRGVYFFLNEEDTALVENDFDFTLEMPPEITLSTCCLIQCKARTLRKETASKELTGVAAEILDYSIVKEPAA
jgi:hypothetical protein